MTAVTVDLLWRQLAQRRFAAAEQTLRQLETESPHDGTTTRARALLVLHRDGVAAAMRLAPLPHDVFLQCYERTVDARARRELTLTQLRSCASSASLAYEEVLEIALFHVLVPSGDHAAALSLLQADRFLSSQQKDLFARLIEQHRTAAVPSSALTPAVSAASNVGNVSTQAIRPRRLSFAEQQQQQQHEQQRQNPPEKQSQTRPATPSPSQRWWLMFLLGSTSVLAVYRAWLFWRRPRALR
jgi:hypothetical protein